MCVCMLYIDAQEGQRIFDPLDLKVLALVSCLTHVLRQNSVLKKSTECS